MRKSIVEFPTIVVVLKDHKYSFDIYDSGKAFLLSAYGKLPP